MKKKHLLLATALLTAGMAKAAATTVADDAIYVWSSESEYTCYLLSGTPTIDYGDNELIISVNGTEAKRISLSEVSDVEVVYGIKYPTVTLNTKGYATLSFKADMQLTSDCMKAYTAKVSGSQIICTEIADGIIPAGNGVLVYGTPSATSQLVEATSTSSLSNNDLQATTLADGSLASVPTTGYTYVLSGSMFGLYTGSTFTADKAYFNLTSKPTASSNSKMSIVFNTDDADLTTAIESAETTSQPTKVYDLQGREVQNPSRGLYIVNGKKVIK